MDLGQASVIVGLLAGLFAIGGTFKPIVIRLVNKFFRKKSSAQYNRRFKPRRPRYFKKK